MQIKIINTHLTIKIHLLINLLMKTLKFITTQFHSSINTTWQQMGYSLVFRAIFLSDGKLLLLADPKLSFDGSRRS